MQKTAPPNHRALSVRAPFLFTSLFLLSGVTHYTNIPYYVELMPGATAFPVFCVVLSSAVEPAGAVMILLNWRPRPPHRYVQDGIPAAQPVC